MKKRAAGKAPPAGLAALTLVATLLLFLAGCTALPGEGSWQVHDGAPVLRLHVRAAGDSPEQQQFKMILVEQIQRILADKKIFQSGDYRTSLLLMQSCLPGLERELREFAGESAEMSPIGVRLSREYFPLRAYGRRILPAGDYTALIVTLGDGEGENWWCLLFPPLCLPPAAADEKDDLTELSSGREKGTAAPVEGEGASDPVRWRSKIWEKLKRPFDYVVEKVTQIFYN